jgi:GDP/UDP-N,N'-diacetylbacillosamine 2-epimerase (hydrolysing)
MAEPIRVLAVTGSRADFGLWQPILREMRRHPDLVRAELVVTAMHLDPRFGATIDEVRAGPTPIAHEVSSSAAGDTRAEMAGAIGVATVGMSRALASAPPDWLLVLGDRGEQLAAAIVGLHLGVAIGHLHGGERTRGAVDDAVRDLITRTAHLHFVASETAAARVRHLGEESWRIHLTGAPGLDAIATRDKSGDAAVRQRYGVPDGRPYLLLVQHPGTVGGETHAADLDASIDAVRSSGLPAIAIGSNNDAGGRALLDRLDTAGLTAHRSVPHDDYLALLSGAAVLVGNSSSGIIEAPMLGVPAVNVGERQGGRQRGDNVIDVPADSDAIAAAIAEATRPEFRTRLSRRSPYGDGRAAPRIVDALLATPIDERLLRKDRG